MIVAITISYVMKIPLNLVYLKYFCDAVKYGGVSAAAEKNYVSQSAVSQGISRLEHSLGIPLLTHQPNRFRLTYEGEKLFKQSKVIFHTITSVEQAMQDSVKHLQGSLQFACTHSFALALLPQYLKKYQRVRPNVHVSFQLAHTDIIKSLLSKGMIDFGVVIDNEDFSGYQIHKLFEGHYHFYRKRDAKGDMQKILSEDRRETILLKNRYRERYGHEFEVDLEVSSWEVIANLVEQGIGTGFIPDYVAQKRKSLIIDDIGVDPIPYQLIAISPKYISHSDATTSFLSMFSS